MMPNFDTKRYTVHRFIMAAYYGMQRTHCSCASSGRFEVELVDEKRDYLPVKQSQEVTQGPLYLCLPFTSSVMASTGW